MILAIDIGNTNINFAVFRGNRIIKKFFIRTDDYSLKKLRNALGKADIGDSIICSVVPQLTKILGEDLGKICNHRVYVLGKNVSVPIKNLYQKPQQVGQDRLVNAYAGVVFYGSPLIVVDFGTAVTFDVVSKNKEYLGGMIFPGLQISLDALSQRKTCGSLRTIGVPANRNTVMAIPMATKAR